MKENIVIVSGARTAIGSFGGSLKNLEATDLGGIAIKEALKRGQDRSSPHQFAGF